MYKSRGKPHEAKNIALDQQRLGLAKAIQIRPINKSTSFRSLPANPRAARPNKYITYRFGCDIDKELKQQKQHFEAFREAYQVKGVGATGVVDDRTAIGQVMPHSHDESKPFEPGPLMKEFLSRYGIRKISELKKPPPAAQQKLPAAQQKPPAPQQKPPALVRNTIRTVKPEYPLQKLLFGGDFPSELTLRELPKPILKKKSSKELTEVAKTTDALKKLKEIEKDLAKSASSEKMLIESTSKTYTPEDREELFKQLEATENQISVATSQLQAIQKILQDNRMLTTVQEEEECEDREKSCQTDETVKQKNERVKWKVKTSLRGSENKRTRLVDTLNLLNNRLQNMQDKYFNVPKMKYKTFDEIVKSSKEHKKKREGIETIYQNMRYDYDSAIELQPTVSSELKQISHKTDINVKRGKSEPKTKTYEVRVIGSYEDNVRRDKSKNTIATSSKTSAKVAENERENSEDVTLTGSSNLSNNTITSENTQANSSKKIDIKNLKSSAELLSEIRDTDVLYEPHKNFDGLKYNNIVFEDDYEDSEDEEDVQSSFANNSGFEKAIEKSIKASDYLTKQFDTLRGNYGMKLDDMLVTKAKNVRFSEPCEVAGRVDQVCSPAADRINHMFSKFNTILKDSLYSTAASTDE